MKKHLRKRRGISSIIANTLLIGIVVATGTVLLIWANTSFDAFKDDLGEVLTARREAARERVVVEEVWFKENSTGKYVVSYIRNYGDIDVNIVSVYLNGSMAWNGTTGISVGRVVSLELEESWVSGRVLWITASTERGKTVKSSWVVK